ncbi:lysoplasmalogenase [Cecembia calidifontis]|jgi:uncharacterized membrane protein YhhN|uniref:Putative membrane protein YhhN n=1 Tax=Cecembia calidifontis TaxID=1187080 RepID=A0A4Q7P4Y8_9BACT|nr:lysoplasmalogenase [Cecembia calidifontis]RZS95083.1 putative membrane protein YhhN [Cecembia calidifontis]
MKRKNIIWLYLFLLISILDIFFTSNGENSIRFYSKPFIIPLLWAYFIFSTQELKGHLIRKAVSAALIFSWMGDTLLMFPKLFIYGLGAFLMAHISYIAAFKVAQRQPFSVGKVDFIRLFFLNFPIYLFAAFVYFYIRGGIGELKIPVIAYLIVIVMMATTARERFNKTNASSFWQVMLGAALFLISDGILALNKFYQEFPEAGVLVMGTYIIAQFLIVRGIMAHIEKEKAG